MEELNLNIFSPTSKDQWKQLAERQLKGGNPDEQLSWKNEADIELHGYYDASDVESLQYLDDYFSSLPSHHWKLYEEVKVLDPKEANEHVLKALVGGCDGVILRIPNIGVLDETLNRVDRSICDISIISEETFHDNSLSGMRITPNGNCGYVDATNPIEQIIKILRDDHQPFVYRFANHDFFLEIATVRALRFLLAEGGRSNVLIHSHVQNHSSKEHQWFLNTTSGLASILGGTHSLDFTTGSGDPRISRNTGNLIKEESGIKEYTDQCRGSYYIEVLTDKIINSVRQKLK